MLMRPRLSTVPGIATGPGARPPTRGARGADGFAADEPRRACLADPLDALRDELLLLVRVEKREHRQAKPRYPVGSTLSAQVERMFPFNHEYWIRFTGGPTPAQPVGRPAYQRGRAIHRMLLVVDVIFPTSYSFKARYRSDECTPDGPSSAKETCATPQTSNSRPPLSRNRSRSGGSRDRPWIRSHR